MPLLTDAPLLPDTGDPGFGLYVHWPFCAAKCPLLRLQQPRAPYACGSAALHTGLPQGNGYDAGLSGPTHRDKHFLGRRTPSLMDPPP